jgi:hypothetical protein
MAHTNLNCLNVTELSGAIVARLAATERSGEGLISYAVLGIMTRDDGDMTVNEFIEAFLPQLPKKSERMSAAKQAAFDEIKRQRNRASQYFRAAKLIVKHHENVIKKHIFSLNDLSIENAGDAVSRYLWKSANATGRYRNEHHVMVALKPMVTPRAEDEKLDSYVNTVIKKLGTVTLKDDQGDKLIEAISLALARGIAETETETETKSETETETAPAPQEEQRDAA